MTRLRLVMFALLIGALSSSGVLMGQDKKGNAEKKSGDVEPVVVSSRLPRNYSKLSLTDKQKKEIYKIRANYVVKIEELNRQIKALKSQEAEDMQKVLTPEQKALLKKLQPAGLSDNDSATDKPPAFQKSPEEKKK